MKVIIRDSHQDWIRIVAVEPRITMDYASGRKGDFHSEGVYERLLFEGHPGDVELDVLLGKLGIEVAMAEWEREDTEA